MYLYICVYVCTCVHMCLHVAACVLICSIISLVSAILLLLPLYMYFVGVCTCIDCRHTVWFLTTVCCQFNICFGLFADTAFGFDVYYELIELFEYCWYPLIYLVFNELLMYWIWYCCIVVPEGAL